MPMAPSHNMAMPSLACHKCRRPVAVGHRAERVTCGRCALILCVQAGPQPTPYISPAERIALVRRARARERR